MRCLEGDSLSLLSTPVFYAFLIIFIKSQQTKGIFNCRKKKKKRKFRRETCIAEGQSGYG